MNSAAAVVLQHFSLSRINASTGRLFVGKMLRHHCCGRCIQRADQPIILTGYAALNKLLGREVYTSHMQLGGPKVSA